MNATAQTQQFRTSFSRDAFKKFCDKCVAKDTKIGMTESGVFFTGKYHEAYDERFAEDRNLPLDLKTFFGCGDRAAWE